MKSIRRARRNLQFIPEKRRAQETAIQHTKEALLKDKPELASELKVRDPATIKKGGPSAVEIAEMCTQIWEEKRLEAE